MFENLKEAIKWAKKEYPGCSFSVKEQEDGPTIISIKGKKDNKEIRTVVYARREEKGG